MIYTYYRKVESYLCHALNINISIHNKFEINYNMYSGYNLYQRKMLCLLDCSKDNLYSHTFIYIVQNLHMSVKIPSKQIIMCLISKDTQLTYISQWKVLCLVAIKDYFYIRMNHKITRLFSVCLINHSECFIVKECFDDKKKTLLYSQYKVTRSAQIFKILDYCIHLYHYNLQLESRSVHARIMCVLFRTVCFC